MYSAIQTDIVPRGQISAIDLREEPGDGGRIAGAGEGARSVIRSAS